MQVTPANASDYVRRLHSGQPVEGDARDARESRRLLESFAEITGDDADAREDLVFLLQQRAQDEKVRDLGDDFKTLLLAADGMRSPAVRDGFQFARGGPDPERSIKLFEKLLERSDADATAALAHLKAIHAVATTPDQLKTVGKQYLALLEEAEPGSRPALAAIFGALKPDEAPRFTRLLKVSGDVGLAAADLKAATDDDRTDLLARLREEGDRSPGAAQALPNLAAESDPERRAARQDAFLRLLAAEGSAARASEDLTWILADTKGDVRGATERLLHVLGKVDGGKPQTARELFNVVQKHVEAEPQGWLARTLGLRHQADKALATLLAIERNPGQAAVHLKAVDAGCAKGETLSEAMARYRKIMMLDELERPDDARAAFTALSTVPASGDQGYDARWDGFQDLLETTKTISGAVTVWNVMAQATTPEELERRQQAFHATLAQENKNVSDALRVFQSAAEGLSGADRMDEALEVLHGLRASGSVDAAVNSYGKALAWRHLPGNPHSDVKSLARFLHGIFSRAETSISEIVQRIQTPLDGETLFQRADLLNDLLATMGGRGAVAEFDWMAKAFAGDDFMETARAYAILQTSVRGARGAAARDICAWLEQKKRDDERFKDVPLADMMQKMAQLLLLNSDLEAARSNFLKQEVKAGTVEKGEEEVVIGGIRVPRKKEAVSQ